MGAVKRWVMGSGEDGGHSLRPAPHQKARPPRGRPGRELIADSRQLVQVRHELLAAVLLAELPQRLLLDLADALAREPEPLAHLDERERLLVPDAEVEPGDLGLARVQRRERPLDVDVEALV